MRCWWFLKVVKCHYEWKQRGNKIKQNTQNHFKPYYGRVESLDLQLGGHSHVHRVMCGQGRSNHFKSEEDRMSSIIPFFSDLCRPVIAYWLNMLFMCKAIKQKEKKE